MLREKLQDPKTYHEVIGRMAKRLIVLPRTQTRVRDPLSHIYTDDEARELVFRSTQRLNATGRAAIPDKRPYLPKWLADVAVPATDAVEHHYRVVVAPSAANAVNRICRLMRRGAYEFARLKTAALRKQVADRYDGAPPKSRLPLTAYHSLTPSERSDYRLMVKATFPDSLVLAALGGLLRDAFPQAYFLPECCGYIPGRGARTAVRQVISALSRGYGTVLRLDIHSFNDTVPQSRLLRLVARGLREAGWPDEDLDNFCGLMRRFFSRIDAVLGTPGVGIGMGTSLTPLFTNIYLNPLDHFIKGQNIPFSRFGDDLALFFTHRSCATDAASEVAAFVSAHLSQQINASKVAVTELGSAPGDGFDFGAYHFYMRADRRPGLRIKAATIGKIRRRIKLLTRIPEGRTAPAPERRMATLIHKVNSLLGFHTASAQGKARTRFLMKGWPAAFLNDASSEEMKQQFRDLDRYILYRLKRVAQARYGDVGDTGQFRQRMREMGLRTFIDAWMRHPRPDRY